ncbi:FixH family protein [Hyphomonas sp.]|uniref:FixH family protein n=1 Tax=Hyphomonas sp. TaxID=87 RepID=UPI00391AD72A
MTAALSPASPPPGTPERKTRGMTGGHTLIWFLTFFGAMFVVNGIFLWVAITTFPGEDVKKSYLTGLEYNREIARRAHQAEAGWQAEAGIVLEGGTTLVEARFLTREGDPLPVIAAEALLRHPADTAFDRSVTLIPLGAGDYAASVEALAPGQWTIVLRAELDPAAEGFDLIATREVFVK